MPTIGMYPIVKEELLRSIAVYFFAFLGIGYIITEGYIDVISKS